jgi:C_GCAxxG_C_C family probable redox protein
MNLEQSSRAVKAMHLFTEGYNCAQSTFLAFNDLVNMPFDEAVQLSASFGGGMGRLREVCGALTGTFMIAGFLYGSKDPNDKEAKTAHYERIQYLAAQFKEKTTCKSYICRDLLGLDIEGADVPVPQDRTADYYAERPCEELVGIAAAILEEYIKTHPYAG